MDAKRRPAAFLGDTMASAEIITQNGCPHDNTTSEQEGRYEVTQCDDCDFKIIGTRASLLKHFQTARPGWVGNQE